MLKKQNLFRRVFFLTLYVSLLTLISSSSTPARAADALPTVGVPDGGALVRTIVHDPVSLGKMPPAGPGPSWLHKRVITIASATDLSNFQVRISLTPSNFSSQAQSAGQDLRFYDSDDTTLLSHWIESYDASGQTATIWVRVPSIPGSALKYIAMYYGNPSAPSTSNGSTTFDFYDGFETPFGDPPLSNAANYQTTPTYDGSGNVVHPNVVYFPSGWNNYKYWMAITPFRSGDSAYENPSILASNDGATWSLPTGLTNPIVPIPPPASTFYADPDLLYDSTSNQLWVYYSFFDDNTSTTYLRRRTSSDGVTWSAESALFSAPHYRLISPSIVRNNGSYYMWSVNAGLAGCSASSTTVERRTSVDGVNWEAAQPVTISQPGYNIWHPKVIYVPSRSEYWMIYAAYPVGCFNSELFFARSTDGLTWTTYSNIALRRSTGWDNVTIYRSSPWYDQANDLLHVWYSAQGSGNAWNLGYTLRNYTSFLSALSTGGGWARESGYGIWASSIDQIRRGAYSGRLVQDVGIDVRVTKSLSLANDFYLEWDLYDDLDSSALKNIRLRNGAGTEIGAGVFTGRSNSNYVYHDRNYSYTATAAPRTQGWHKFGVLLRPDSSVSFFVDDQSVGTLSGQFNNATQVAVMGWGASNATTTFYVDDVRVRKFAATDPTVAVGSETPTAVVLSSFGAHTDDSPMRTLVLIGTVIGMAIGITAGWRVLRRRS